MSDTSTAIRSEDSVVGRMGEKRGMKALEAWCKRVTDGYKGVHIENMTTSWRDGLAFCAIIHHFRPDLIEFDSLDKNDIYRNNELAFRTAENHLGIPALLDAEDMVMYEVPDRLSILTYLSQFYQTFTGHGSSPTRSLSKRPASATGALSPVAQSPPSKVAARMGRREPCAKCGLPVFIAERLLVAGHLYHRTCFRCARCQHQLSIANCYETEGGEYCCETCPDEILADTEKLQNKSNLDIIGHAGLDDEYSAEFESAMEETHKQSAQDQPIPKFSKARSDFMSSQLTLADSQDADSVHSVSDSESSDSRVPSSRPSELHLKEKNSYLSSDTQSRKDTSVVDKASSHSNVNNIAKKYFSTKSDNSDTAGGSEPSGNLSEKDVPKRSDDELITANIGVNSQVKESTKDSDLSQVSSSSIVKMRLKLFENSGQLDDSSKASKTMSNKRHVLNQDDSLNEDDTVSSHDEAVFKDLTQKDILNTSDKVRKPVDKVTILTEDVDVDEFEGIYEDSLKTESQLDFDELAADDKVINTCLTVPGDSLGQDKSDTPKAASPNTSLSVPSDSLGLDKSDTPKAVSPVIKIAEPDSLQASSSSELLNKEVDIKYPDDLNPFEDEGEEEEVNRTSEKSSSTKAEQETNPFGSDDDEEEVKPAPRQRVISAPRVSLNPFWSDGEEPSSEEEGVVRREKPPVPLPRKTIGVSPEPSPMPRKSLNTNISDKFGSVSSLSSLNSSTGGTSSRKKKLAPNPPRAQDVFLGTPSTLAASAASSRTASPTPSSGHSPKTTPRHRKKSRPAPPPPGTLTFAEAKLIVSDARDTNSPGSVEWEREKNKKDVANRNRQSQSLSTHSSSPVSPSEQLSVGPNKSTYGQWKRKKGPAPPRPVPQRRQIRAIPMKDVRRELDDIEVQQQELERQGVTLEKTIRDKFDQLPNPQDDTTMTPDVEDLVLQLFELVNEKNELFRRQAELMYLRRQQRLEEEHADLEYQIRCLMLRPEHTKTDSDKAREEELIQRLVEVVERRNEIVECLEMDRIREAEEDRSIHTRLGLLSKGKTLSPEDISPSKLHKKVKKKLKKDKEKHSSKKAPKLGLDADKDIDEVEQAVPKHLKEKKTKRKWF